MPYTRFNADSLDNIGPDDFCVYNPNEEVYKCDKINVEILDYIDFEKLIRGYEQKSVNFTFQMLGVFPHSKFYSSMPPTDMARGIEVFNCTTNPHAHIVDCILESCYTSFEFWKISKKEDPTKEEVGIGFCLSISVDQWVTYFISMSDLIKSFETEDKGWVVFPLHWDYREYFDLDPNKSCYIDNFGALLAEDVKTILIELQNFLPKYEEYFDELP